MAAAARGSGIAAVLLRHGENVIATRFDRAWLAAASGNTRARRFYEREGWRDTGALDFAAHDGGPFVVACHRYEKQLVRRPD